MSSSPTPPAPPPEAERSQILKALAVVCVRDGYLKTTPAAVAEAAGLPKEAFERHFDDLEDCFAAFLLETREQFLVDVGSAMLQHSAWRDQMRAAAYAILDFWRADERRARMILVEVLSAGPRAQLVRDEGMEMMADLIDQGRASAPAPDLLTKATAEAVAGAMFNQMRAGLERGELDRGEELVPQLMYSVVLPYLGTEAALEELEMPPPRSAEVDILPGVPDEEELGPLPPGRHGFSREHVSAHQRERIVAGLAEAVAERGYHAVTITQIAKAAHVSKRAFYENFESKEECFLAAFEIVVSHLRAVIEEEIEPIPDWPHRVVAGLRALLAFLGENPDLARLCLVDSVTAGPAVGERFREQINGFVPLLKPGRAERDNPRPLPDSTEESLIGALVSMLSRSLAFGDPDSLPELLPDFVEFVLMPYVGPADAHRLAQAAA